MWYDGSTVRSLQFVHPEGPPVVYPHVRFLLLLPLLSLVAILQSTRGGTAPLWSKRKVPTRHLQNFRQGVGLVHFLRVRGQVIRR